MNPTRLCTALLGVWLVGCFFAPTDTAPAEAVPTRATTTRTTPAPWRAAIAAALMRVERHRRRVAKLGNHASLRRSSTLRWIAQKRAHQLARSQKHRELRDVPRRAFAAFARKLGYRHNGSEVVVRLARVNTAALWKAWSMHSERRRRLESIRYNEVGVGVAPSSSGVIVVLLLGSHRARLYRFFAPGTLLERRTTQEWVLSRVRYGRANERWKTADCQALPLTTSCFQHQSLSLVLEDVCSSRVTVVPLAAEGRLFRRLTTRLPVFARGQRVEVKKQGKWMKGTVGYVARTFRSVPLFYGVWMGSAYENYCLTEIRKPGSEPPAPRRRPSPRPRDRFPQSN